MRMYYSLPQSKTVRVFGPSNNMDGIRYTPRTPGDPVVTVRGYGSDVAM